MTHKVEFDGGYGRTGAIEVLETTCSRCSNVRPCITMDSSEGEYYSGAICRSCALIMYAVHDKHKSKPVRSSKEDV